MYEFIRIQYALGRITAEQVRGFSPQYITAEQAKADYGVIVDPDTFEVTGFTPEREAVK